MVKEFQKWKKCIDATKMAMFEAPGTKKLIHHFQFSENLEDIYRKCCWRARS